MSNRVSIIVRCLNHQGEVFQMYTEIDRVLGEVCPTAEIVFVDEGSTDRTVEYLAAIARKDKRVRVVEWYFSKNDSSFLPGVRPDMSVLSEVVGERIVVLDGAGVGTVQMIRRLLEKLEAGADWVSWGEDCPFTFWGLVGRIGRRLWGGKLPFTSAGTISAFRRVQSA